MSLRRFLTIFLSVIFICYGIFGNFFCNPAFAFIQKIKKKEDVPVNLSPKTYEEYLERSKDIKVYEYNLKEPKFPINKNYINDVIPKVFLTQYNYPAGSITVDLTKLSANGRTYGQGVATPLGDKLVYSEIYYDKVNKRVMSELYEILNVEDKSIYKFLKSVNIAKRINVPLMTSGITDAVFGQQNVLIPIDWSADGNLLAVKETIGNNHDGIWQNNIWVYDFRIHKAKELTAVRKTIIDWWKNNKDLDLNKYIWNLYPLGWDAKEPDSLVVVAYAKKNNRGTFFLGEWLVNISNESPVMTSLTEITRSVQSNGLSLKFDKKY